MFGFFLVRLKDFKVRPPVPAFWVEAGSDWRPEAAGVRTPGVVEKSKTPSKEQLAYQTTAKWIVYTMEYPGKKVVHCSFFTFYRDIDCSCSD